jgi:Papain fold toxin 2
VEIGVEAIFQVSAIAQVYLNFECVECAQAIQDYLIAHGIHGRRIELYTGTGIGRNSYIYDDSIVGGDAISLNGRHIAIAIMFNEVEIVFDNHHPEGIPKDQWINNLQFYGKIHLGQQFQITEEEF